MLRQQVLLKINIIIEKKSTLMYTLHNSTFPLLNHWSVIQYAWLCSLIANTILFLSSPIPSFSVSCMLKMVERSGIEYACTDHESYRRSVSLDLPEPSEGVESRADWALETDHCNGAAQVEVTWDVGGQVVDVHVQLLLTTSHLFTYTHAQCHMINKLMHYRKATDQHTTMTLVYF